MVETPDVVVPMESLPDPMSINFLYKATNVSGASVYVSAQLITPPAGWADYAERQCGELGVGVDDYFLFATPTRTKPATGTTEVVTLRVTYYSDAGYSVELNHEDIAYTYTYVDFDDAVTYNVVDEDTFEVDLEGWTGVVEVGTPNLVRDTAKARTGIGSMKHGNFETASVGYATKSFIISNIASAFIRVWLLIDMYYLTYEHIVELITDAGGIVEKRTLPIAMDGTPKCGTEIVDQWLCVAAKIPVNGTYEVRLRGLCEVAHPTSDYLQVYYDDIKVIETVV